jgi:hypothetical protein
MAGQRSDDLQRSREEAALLLRLDPQNLSPADALKCDLISTLRLSIDSAQADALEGRAADLGRLIVATESLVKLLPSDPPKPAAGVRTFFMRLALSRKSNRNTSTRPTSSKKDSEAAR